MLRRVALHQQNLPGHGQTQPVIQASNPDLRNSVSHQPVISWRLFDNPSRPKPDVTAQRNKINETASKNTKKHW